MGEPLPKTCTREQSSPRSFSSGEMQASTHQVRWHFTTCSSAVCMGSVLACAAVDEEGECWPIHTLARSEFRGNRALSAGHGEKAKCSEKPSGNITVGLFGHDEKEEELTNAVQPEGESVTSEW